jgi:RNA-directed DNA polymerase
MDRFRKSDSAIVPEKLANKVPLGTAEAMEGRELTEGNLLEQNALRTQGRKGVPSALEWVREAAQRGKGERFTALFHHVYDINRLREAYGGLKRQAVPGIDGETWQHYGQNLEGNLKDLSERLKRGAYRAKPAQRAYIPKTEGKE